MKLPMVFFEGYTDEMKRVLFFTRRSSTLILRGYIIEYILYRKYYRHYSSVVFSTLTIIYCPTHLNKIFLTKLRVKPPNYSQLNILKDVTINL
jgi:hypothetical protein